MIELEAEWSLELIIKIDERNFKIFCLQLARERDVGFNFGLKKYKTGNFRIKIV